MASHNLKAGSLLRHKFPRLLIPFGCIVAYRGESFEVGSISPLSINTIVYGSDTQGITCMSSDLEAEELAQGIVEIFNLKPHKFVEQCEIDSKPIEHNIWLPYSVQLHGNKGVSEEIFFYIINPGSLFCCDTILTNDPENIPKLIVRQFRPEWLKNNNSTEIVNGYFKQTWKSPTRGVIGANFIKDYEYFYYEKRNLDKQRTILTQYYCCKNCYYEVNADINSRITVEENAFIHQYPWHKFEMRELPENKRGITWINEETGSIVTQAPLIKININPDAGFNSLGIEASEEDIGDIIKSKRKLLDETIPEIIEDLDNGLLNVTTPSELGEMFKEMGINMRHIQKIASYSQKDHIRELAVIEIIGRKGVEVVEEGLEYQDIIDTDVFDKISTNMMTQRLSELLKIPIEVILNIDFQAEEPFKDIELPDLRYKECSWNPISLKIMIEEARKLEKIGKETKDAFSPLKKKRNIATEYYKKAGSICEKIFGDESLRMASLLLELGKN